MWWLWSILSVLVILFTWMLISPIEVWIDTRKPVAEIKLKSLFSLRVWLEEKWKFRFKILFFSKSMDLSTMLNKKKKPAKPKPASRKGAPISWKKFKRILNSFIIEECKLSIDSGDYVLNSQLYPLNFLPQWKNSFRVNFENQNYLILRIRNRPWRILYAFLRS